MPQNEAARAPLLTDRVNSSSSWTAAGLLDEANQFYIALAYMIVSAVTVVYLGSRRNFRTIKRGSNGSHEVVHGEDAAIMPIAGSVMLFTLYVVLKFVPRSYINTLLSLYLSIMGIFSLGSFLGSYIRPNVITGTLCTVIGVYYIYSGNWIANNILATAISIAAVEMVHLNSFMTASILLAGLFLYDIFWVFGTDVMLTVATRVDGPIKIVFPQTIFGDHTKKSLLGLGDIIIPGFYIAQTLVFSQEKVKRGTRYFKVALFAYTMSLINTMVVLVVFKRGQPALLFIVPWLLICVPGATLLYGDFSALLDYNATSTIVSHDSPAGKRKKATKQPPRYADEALAEDSFWTNLWSGVCTLYGFGCSESKPRKSQGPAADRGANHRHAKSSSDSRANVQDQPVTLAKPGTSTAEKSQREKNTPLGTPIAAAPPSKGGKQGSRKKGD